MTDEELNQRYSTDFIESFNNFKSGSQFHSRKFNEYDEDTREKFFDYCLNLCAEENADIDTICNFAYLSVYNIPDSCKTFLDFCTKLSDISEKNAVTTFKYCKRFISGNFGNGYSDKYSPQYFVNFIKKYPQKFFESYPLELPKFDDFAKIIRTAPQTAPIIVKYINDELDRPNPFEYIKNDSLALKIFEFAEQSARGNIELRGEMASPLNKIATLAFVDSDDFEAFIYGLENHASFGSVLSVMNDSDFADYLRLLVQNPQMTANSFALLFRYNDRLKISEQKKAEENCQVFSNILENKIKNHEIRAIDCLESRGFSEALYKLIIDTAEKEISEQKYDDIEKIAGLIENYRYNEIDKNVDVLNLLKLADKVLGNADFEKDFQTDSYKTYNKYETFCSLFYPNRLQGMETLSETPEVIYSILSKLTALKTADFASEAHILLRTQAEADLIPVADLLHLSEKMTENSIFDDNYTLGSILHFYAGVLDKDPSLSDRMLSLIEKHLREENIKYLSLSDLENIGDTFSEMITTKPEIAAKILGVYSKSLRSYENFDMTSRFFKTVLPRLNQLNDIPMSKETAEEAVQLANILMETGKKTFAYRVAGLPVLVDLCDRVVHLVPEYSGEVLSLLNKNKYYFNTYDQTAIDNASKSIIASPKIRQKQTLLDIISNLNSLKNNRGKWDIAVEFANNYRNPVEYLQILKENFNDKFWSDSKGIKTLNTLISRTAVVEPEIRELMPKIIKDSNNEEREDIYKLHFNLFNASKDNLYLKSLEDFCSRENKIKLVESGLIEKILETSPNSEGVRIVLDIISKQVKADWSDYSTQSNINTDTFLKTCNTIIDKKLLPINEVCDCIFNSCTNISSNKFKILCSGLRRIRTKHPKTAPKILHGLVDIAQKRFQTWEAAQIVTEIVKVFGDGGTRTAANIILTMDKNFEFLKYYAGKKSNFDIFYHLNKKLAGNRQYLDVMIQNVSRADDLGGKETKDLLITPLRNYVKVAAELFNKDNLYGNSKYQKYDYLNEPNANLKEQSIYGKISDEVSSGDVTYTPAAVVNMVEALIPYVGRVNNPQAGNLNTAWSELVSYLPQEKQNKIYEQFENCKDLFYTFTLYMALSSPEMWKKYGKYIADADGHNGLKNNPIYNYGLSPADIFSATTSALEIKPEERPKLEPILRELVGDNITDLYFEHKDLLQQLRHRESSYARLINASTNKAANFLDAFTEKMKDIAAEPGFAGNRNYECLSEAMDNNPNGFNQKAQETFEAMLQEKEKYFSLKTNSHNNAFVRNLFPQISNKVDKLCEKLGVEDINECLDYEKRYHKCAVGLYQHNKEIVETLDDENIQKSFSDISSQIVYDMANSGVDNVFWAMNTIKVFKKLNERPRIYNSSYNKYPVDAIVPYSKVNMPDWMYKVAIDNQLPQQRLGSVKNLFDKCNAVKRAPHLASWASEAKQIGKMPLWYQVAAGAITKKLHEGVSEHEWKHNLELREIFWQEMKAVQEMGYVKAMQTYIEGGIIYDHNGEPKRDSKDNYILKNTETRQAISALLENKKIENDADHYQATINTLADEDALDKMFAKEDKSKKLDSRDILKTRKIIAMREEFKKAKGKKQKINAIRDKHTQENTETTHQTPVKQTVENKVSAMRKALLKARQSKQEQFTPEADGTRSVVPKPINSDTDLLEAVTAKKLTDKIIDKK